MSQTKVASRKEIPPQHMWDVSSVFPSDETWEAALERVAARLPDLDRFRGHLGDGPATLADYFEVSEQIRYDLGHVTLYARMGHVVDLADQEATAKNDRARGLSTRVLAALAFAEPEMMEIGFETLRKWAREEPRLTVFEHFFDMLERRSEHIRSTEIEELLSQVAEPFRMATATHNILTDAELTFPPAGATDEPEPIAIAQGNIDALLRHPDRQVRRTAWENYADAHLTYKNTTANCIATGVKQHVFLARARRYSSSLEASLKPSHVPTEVFYNLVNTYRENIPTWHRYWRLRRRALGYDKLHAYDIKAPLISKMPRVPFEQAVEWIAEGMRPLGDEYVDVMRRGVLEQRWVDFRPNRGKHAGAFSTGMPGTHPFILMSYTDDIFSLSTLAHELGHSLHSYNSRKTQPRVYARYSSFLAEVASNFNQAMVRAYLLETETDPDFQIAVIEEAMANFHRYFFIMPTLACFELELHERAERGQALTAQDMITLMADLFREGYGDEVEVDTERVGITWAQFPLHLYLNFYVFQYSTGISGAHALAERVLAGAEGAAENYRSFLQAGNSIYPLEALELAGVDLASPEPVEKTFAVLSRMVDRLEELIA